MTRWKRLTGRPEILRALREFGIDQAVVFTSDDGRAGGSKSGAKGSTMEGGEFPVWCVGPASIFLQPGKPPTKPVAEGLELPNRLYPAIWPLLWLRVRDRLTSLFLLPSYSKCAPACYICPEKPPG